MQLYTLQKVTLEHAVIHITKGHIRACSYTHYKRSHYNMQLYTLQKVTL